MISILHHWPHSGGSVFAQAIASASRSIYISDFHPLAYRQHIANASSKSFESPGAYNLLHQLSLDSNDLSDAALVAFSRSAIDAICAISADEGRPFLLRNNICPDYFLQKRRSAPPLLFELLRQLPLRHLVIIRHPLDSWLELMESGMPNDSVICNLDDFCYRCLDFMESVQGFPKIRYEAFCLVPQLQLDYACHFLGLSPDHGRLESANIPVPISGKRGTVSSGIAPLSRRPYSYETLVEAASSASYQQLCGLLEYNPDPVATFPYICPSSTLLLSPRDFVSTEAQCSLYLQLWDDILPHRLEQVKRALLGNIFHPAVNRVVLFLDGTPDISWIPSFGKDLKCVPIDGRLRYSDFLSYVAHSPAGDGFAILLNSDICLDKSFSCMPSFRDSTCLAVTRTECTGFLAASDRGASPANCQDVWIFRHHRVPNSLIRATDIPLGVPGCENRFAAELFTAGYRVYNPCLDLVFRHADPSPEWNYPWNSPDRLRGTYAYLNPCKLVDVDSRDPRAFIEFTINSWHDL